MPKFLGMEPRVAWWVIGGAVVLVVVVLALRGRGAAGGAAATGPTGFGETPLEGTGGGGGFFSPGGLLGQQQDQQSGYERQLQELALSSARSEAALYGKQAEYEGQLLASETAYRTAVLETETQKQKMIKEKLAAMDPRKAVKPARGRTKIDPDTGQLYGREETGRSVFQRSGDVFFSAAQQYASAYAGSHTLPVRRTRGTPPIVAPPYGGRPV